VNERGISRNYPPKGELMKLKWLALLGVMLLAVPASAAEKTVLKTEKDKVNYGIGVRVGRNFQQQGMEVDVDLVVQGMKDVLSGKKPLMSEDELQKTITAYAQELQQKQAQEKKLAAKKNHEEGDAFLAANKKKEGVVTRPSGLQYKVIKGAEGKKPTAEDTVEVKYRATFINGKEFDTSGGEVRAFKLSELVPGWQEALQLMPVGSKWQLFVPPALAYADKGLGQIIMPNTTLLFELELVGIKPATAEAPKAEPPGKKD
jgi:FKBP-type peptidyl-prolyl cis-trans isomerase